MDEIERYFPINGPCLMCGTPGFSARHRVIDAIRDRVKAGEAVDAVADDFELPISVVRALCALNTRAYGKIRRMPMEDWQREWEAAFA